MSTQAIFPAPPMALARYHLWILLVGPVLQPQLQECVVDALRGVWLQFAHMLQERFQLSRVVCKDGDELLGVGLGWRKERDEEGAGEMAQRLRAVTALPEVLSSISSNHMVTHNHL